jgi:hypothetical protein
MGGPPKPSRLSSLTLQQRAKTHKLFGAVNLAMGAQVHFKKEGQEWKYCCLPKA